MKTKAFLACIALFISYLTIQAKDISYFRYIEVAVDDSTYQKFLNWYNLDPNEDEIMGVSTERAYQLLENKKSKTVIVAVIDSGIDIEHEDLQGNIWTNTDEIAGNGKDDDNNGYVDDVHGWNFLGNAKGENVKYENLEITRLYRKYKKQFEDKKESDIPADQKSEYQRYKKLKKDYFNELQKVKEEKAGLESLIENYKFARNVIEKHLDKKDFTKEDLLKIESDEDMIKQTAGFLLMLHENNVEEDDLTEGLDYYNNRIDYHFNLDFNPRSIIGDNPADIQDSIYGNNDVEGEDAGHGTHVAGIIGAERNNDLGINGIAKNVKIMAIRAVPEGDERDKDVANAIIYAVRNGADVINCSFGKKYTAHKQFVDRAIRYAQANDVLIIHAAGNDADNVDQVKHYPTNIYANGEEAPNWITVGASGMHKNLKLAGIFSNYGQNVVDVFAPGVDIYSLKPDDKYDLESGTSMACPATTGVAALIMSYYPKLTAPQVAEIIKNSTTECKWKKVYIPKKQREKKNKKIRFKKLSVSGGIVNAYKAVKMAEKMATQK